jgi:hypothetical protein
MNPSLSDNAELSGSAVWASTHTLFSASGNRYVGVNLNPLCAGKGDFRCDLHANTYRGEYAGTVFEGVGVMEYGEGDSYAGEWRAARWHGLGLYRWSAGDVYCGQFEADMMEGLGVYRKRNDDAFFGTFRADLMDGPGVFCHENGDRYFGSFQAGAKAGFGVYEKPVLEAFRLCKACKRWFQEWTDGRLVSSVPFDRSIVEHGGVLRSAMEAKVAARLRFRDSILCVPASVPYRRERRKCPWA